MIRSPSDRHVIGSASCERRSGGVRRGLCLIPFAGIVGATCQQWGGIVVIFKVFRNGGIELAIYWVWVAHFHVSIGGER